MKTNTRYRWVNPDKGRYYEAWLSQDLLGDWVVTRVNGSLQNKKGQIRHTPCASETAGLRLLDQIHRNRLRPSHGYMPLHSAQ